MSHITTIPAWRTDGVLMSRLFAYLIDLLVISVWSIVAAVLIFFLGFVTLSLGWWLFLFLPFVGLLYSALTVGGRHQATVGMRLFGLKVARFGGGPVDVLTAAVHALFFYVAVTTFVVWLLDVLVALFSEERRMLHDLLTGLVVVRP